MTSTSTQTVTLINAFEVPPEADEPFIAGWERARDFLAGRDGFSATALHRAWRADAAFRFVHVARLASPEAWARGDRRPRVPGRRDAVRGAPRPVRGRRRGPRSGRPRRGRTD